MEKYSLIFVFSFQKKISKNIISNTFFEFFYFIKTLKIHTSFENRYQKSGGFTDLPQCPTSFLTTELRIGSATVRVVWVRVWLKHDINNILLISDMTRFHLNLIRHVY